MVQQFHNGMQARVQNNIDISEPFLVTSGVKQGCVMVLTLLSAMYSAVLTDAISDKVELGIRYFSSGKLFKLRRLQSKTKEMTNIVRDFLFANDCPLRLAQKLTCTAALTSSLMHAQTSAIVSVPKRLRSCICQPKGNCISPIFTVSGQKLNTMKSFTYLHNMLSQNIILDNEVKARIAKGSM